MKVLQISVFDRVGGACIAAYRQHLALLRYGVDSQMWVRGKVTADPKVWSYEPPAAFARRAKRVVRRIVLAREAAAAGMIGEFFDDRSEYGGDEWTNLPDCDVINVQFSPGFLDHPTFYRNLPADKPVVVTLHEMSCFTGGCSYAGSCSRFHAHCGDCPQLGVRGGGDYSRQGWIRRRESYAARKPGTLHFVADSHWIAAQAKASGLLRNYPVSVIHYGLDTEVFRPIDKTAARAVFGIHEGIPVVAFAAAAVADERKGIRHLVEALKAMPATPFLLTWGRSFPPALESIPHLHVGNIDSEHLMAMTYNAADLFVMPSLEEAFGQTALEALACGVPVVAYAAGGIPDMVRHEQTGLLAPVGDSVALAAAMGRLTGDLKASRTMGSQGRSMVLQEFSMTRNAEHYLALYQSLVGKTLPTHD
jgi:hypothetical protein